MLKFDETNLTITLISFIVFYILGLFLYRKNRKVTIHHITFFSCLAAFLYPIGWCIVVIALFIYIHKITNSVVDEFDF